MILILRQVKKKMKNFKQRKHNQIFPVKIILVVSVRLSVNRKVKNKTKVSVHSGLGSVIMLYSKCHQNIQQRKPAREELEAEVHSGWLRRLTLSPADICDGDDTGHHSSDRPHQGGMCIDSFTCGKVPGNLSQAPSIQAPLLTLFIYPQLRPQQLLVTDNRCDPHWHTSLSSGGKKKKQGV